VVDSACKLGPSAAGIRSPLSFENGIATSFTRLLPARDPGPASARRRMRSNILGYAATHCGSYGQLVSIRCGESRFPHAPGTPALGVGPGGR
jgi:hypothetical protein